jgi:hypothetical protein
VLLDFKILKNERMDLLKVSVFTILLLNTPLLG